MSVAAKDLGISTESLRNWVKQVDLDTGRRKGGLTSEERQEPVRLRRENRNFREDKEILNRSKNRSTATKGSRFGDAIRIRNLVRPAVCEFRT